MNIGFGHLGLLWCQMYENIKVGQIWSSVKTMNKKYYFIITEIIGTDRDVNPYVNGYFLESGRPNWCYASSLNQNQLVSDV